jgi:hypothetical protein
MKQITLFSSLCWLTLVFINNGVLSRPQQQAEPGDFQLAPQPQNGVFSSASLNLPNTNSQSPPLYTGTERRPEWVDKMDHWWDNTKSLFSQAWQQTGSAVGNAATGAREYVKDKIDDLKEEFDKNKPSQPSDPRFNGAMPLPSLPRENGNNQRNASNTFI